MVKPIPDGYHSVTPYLAVDDAAAAIDFYKRAFGAEELIRMPVDDKVAHAELRIGDSVVMLADETPSLGHLGPQSRGGATAGFMIYVDDVDQAFRRALDAGGIEKRPLRDQFYGDRSGTLEDPFGHSWTLATHVEDVPPDEMERRMANYGQNDMAEETA